MTLVWLLLGLLVLWLAVIVVRALQFKPYPMEKTEAENFPVDEKRALERFQDMIRLKTVSYPDEKLEDPQAFADFQKLLAEAYPAVTKTCPREILGRRGMLYHWKGKSSAKPSVLMAHYDVVPVNENEWQEPPFGAVVKDGELWGRGTLDTKGTLHGVMEAAEMLIGQGFVPENDVYFAFGGDEEIFGGDAPAIVEELKKRGIEHNVLNAKQHEREAEIVAQAGKQGAVTIATNMAGRGTDIMLGGNVTYMAKATLRKELTRQMNADLEVLKDEYEHAKARAKAQGLPIPPAPDTAYEAKVEMLMTECDGHADTQDADILAARKRFDELVAEYEPEVKREAEAVREAGGLFIIGTERHESRRIDNQLRGRAGRQGDPGASRFFLSLEDDLMRIFGGERVQNLMDSLGLDEDVPIENKLITNTIESAQKKLEASNFAIRKQVLQYDDVMNQQREIIYKQRQMVLDGEDISGKLHEMMRQSIDDACANYLNGETADDWDFAGLRRHFMNWLCLPTDFNYTTEQLGELTREGIADELYKRGMDILTAKEKRYGEKTMRELERICLLRNVDSKWMEHIDNMDQLKQGMGLRGYGQHDPVVEYRIEGFAMFDEMIASIREDAVHMLLTIEIRQQNAEPKREQVAKPTGEGAPAQAGAKGAAPVRVTKIGRNDPCPCGSGLKWKKCTCKEYHPDL